MRVKFIANYASRQIYPADRNQVVAVRQDHNADVIRIVLNPSDFEDVGINLANAAKKIVYKEPGGDINESTESKVVAPVGTPLDDGTYAVDWTITGDVTDQSNRVVFALIIQEIDDDVVTAAWYSVPSAFSIADTLDDVDGPYVVPVEEEATASEQISALQNTVAALQITITELTSALEAAKSRITSVETDMGYTLGLESLPATN